ncbi:MAG: DNA polymerase IV [bacterium]
MSGEPVKGGSAAQGAKAERVIALVDMNAFFAQVEQICNPSLRGKPILVGGSPTKRSIVTAASYEARPYGIKAGMSYFEALRLCPNAVIVEGNTTKYLDYCYRIVAVLREFSDIVEAFSIDEAFLDLTGVQSLLGTPEEIGRQIKERLREELELSCSVGIGPNKLVAKMAAEWQKPDGLTRVWPEELPHILRPFPVEELVGVGRRMRAKLGALGITTIVQLADYDVELLTRKFGVYGELLHQWANGADDSPVDPEVFLTVKSMGHSYTLPYDTDDAETIEWFLFWLADRVGRRLRRDGYHGRTVTLSVRNSDMSGFTRSRTLPFPIATGQAMRDAALDLFRENVPPGMKVRLLGVGLSNLTPDRFTQLSFDGEHRRRDALAAMDRVKDRYGDSSITFAALLGRPNKFIRKKIGVFLTNKEKGRPDSPLNPRNEESAESSASVPGIIFHS